MHILLLRQQFSPPDESGSGRPYEMARRWVEAGHQVTIVTSTAMFSASYKMTKKVNHLDIGGIKIIAINVPYNNTYSYFRRVLSFFSFAHKAVKVAKSIEKVDVVLGSSTPLTIALPSVKLSKYFGCPMVFEVRDLWPEMPIAIGALRSPITKFLAKRLELFAYRNAHRIIALSPGMVSGVAATGYPENQIALVPNTSDVARFRGPEVSAENFLAEHPSLRGRQLVVYAGTLGRLNSVEYLAEIAKEMQALNPQVAFLVFGGGGCRELVQQSAQQLGVLDHNFFMMGSIPKNKIPDVFAASSVCVSLFVNIPEMWKNSANKFFDTLAAGKPILINYQGWQLDLINEHNIGVGVPAEDPLVAATKLNELLSNNGALQEASENSKAMGAENFHVDELSARALSVLKSAVETYA